MDIETAARLIGAKDEEVVSVEETDDGTVIRTVGGPPLIVVDGVIHQFGVVTAPDSAGKPQVVDSRLPVFMAAPAVEADDEGADDAPVEPEPEKKRPAKKAAAKALAVEADDE